MKVEFLEAAESELQQAYQWYELQHANLGNQFLDEFDAAVKRLVTFPKAYALMGDGLRRCLIKRFPYGIWYGLDEKTILIVAVAHLHRKPDYWLERMN